MADDLEMWRQICRGNAEVFDSFYRENAPRLQAFLRQIVCNPQVAEDITQEVFTKIWCRPNGFQPERGTLRAYVYGIGRKMAADSWRQRRPEDTVPQAQLGADRAEVTSIVGDAFARLPLSQRILLWLREVEGQSYAELAQSLEVPLGTVRSRLSAAREALRNVWKGVGQGPKEGA